MVEVNFITNKVKIKDETRNNCFEFVKVNLNIVTRDFLHVIV